MTDLSIYAALGQAIASRGNSYFGNRKSSKKYSKTSIYAKPKLRRSRMGMSTDIHRYYHTAQPVYCAYQTGSTGSTGFVLPGTTSLSTNPGLQIQFDQGKFTVFNNNSGVATGQFLNAISYSALYDMFKINSVRLRIFFTATQTSSPLNGANHGGVLYAVKDYDDLGVPTLASQLLDYPDVLIRNTNTSSAPSKEGSVIEFKLQPKFQSGVALTSNTTASGTRPASGFLNLTGVGAATQHLGIKIFLDDFLQMQVGAFGIPGIFSFVVSYDITYKGVK